MAREKKMVLKILDVNDTVGKEEIHKIVEKEGEKNKSFIVIEVGGRNNGSIPNNLTTIPFNVYQFCTTQSEFNASIFVPNFVNEDVQLSLPAKKAQSLLDLRTIEDNLPLGHEKFNQWQPWMSQSITETNSVILPTYPSKQDLNPRLSKYASVDALNDINRNHHIIKNRSGFYAQPVANYGVPIYYGPLDGPDFLIYKKKLDKLNSKSSISNTSVDDVNLNDRDIEDYLSKLQDGWLSEDGLDDQDSDDENRDADEVIRVLQEENDDNDDDVDETADIDPPLVEPEDQEPSQFEAYDANISLNENLTPEYRMELPEKQNYKDINSTCDIPKISRRCINC
ncbi:hypothetical protein RN001_000365 [Aquatica leii]|uniref:Uncharacterized protein n=1 Tax=Aquatica leii TaxID=1421715 RepID=A0AAN7PEU1_9COLE|nr:hypothetical protein RN001_000365 [Aquatica leii]